MEQFVIMDKKADRNMGIDELRIVAMFSIVILHILKHGGILENVTGAQFYIVWFLESIVICSVDCYALISGYVGYSDLNDQDINYRKALRLWMQVWFFSIVLYMLFSQGGGNVKEFLKACLPITTNQYWYYTAYVGVFIAEPWINRLIARLSEEELRKFIGVILCVVVLYIPLVGVLYDPFKVEGGYSALWLVLLYVIGALIKKTNLPEKYSQDKFLVIAILCIALSFTLKILVPAQRILVTYISPTTLIFSICMLVLFSKREVAGKMVNIISLLSSLTFGVYLVHDNITVRQKLISNKFTWALDYSPIVTFGVVIAGGLIVFSLSAFVELFRQKLFKILKVDSWQTKIMEWIKVKL